MLNRALLTGLIGLSLTLSSFADPARTRVTGSSKTKSVYENYNDGPMRTTLTRENKFPDTGQVEIGGFYTHMEISETIDRDNYGVYGRVGISEFVTVEASLPIADSTVGNDSHTGIGDIGVKLDLLAYQDIYQYPFIIPHVDVTLPTGDEDDHLGTGNTVITIGVSIGTKVYDVLTYVIDFAYSIKGGTMNAQDEDVGMVSGSLVWDISDRFAVFAEGRVLEENKFDETPYTLKGGMAYRFTPNVQLSASAGTARDDMAGNVENKNDIGDIKLSVQF